MNDHEWRLATTTDHDGQEDWPRRTTDHNRFSRWVPHQRRLTTQRVRALCYFVFYISAPFFWLNRTCSCTPFDIWGGVLVWVEICHCFGRCQHTVRQVLCKKTCLYADFDTRDHDCVCSFQHNFAVVYPTWRVSTKLYQLRHMKTCTFSLKSHVSALFWFTRTCPCPTFNIRGHDGAETFHCFDHRIGPWDAFTVKRRASMHLFDLTKTCIRGLINK